ncbi:metallophosphoesterase [Polymorphum gilvum]|uniref:Serine/threonine protein phosphatase family protein n=1 Tax=Polymorphum gilvum (strain LMG 25793 / CGMCC 1.9160 / SL003B-26A1) TaxID=991905 RepID=F2IW59_POLGS|nr:metallophosphoesterase [Polymorphum gilvum]ADZ71444.1 Serine/threonine protein phosphatase family protein [Polymorphum gilvum SL003B-26A1]
MILRRFRRLLDDLQARTSGPLLPEGTRVYAVGDIHGRFDLLWRLAGAIEADLAARPVARVVEVYLGDYVDRGPDSARVVDWLSRPAAGGRERICLMGNHEHALLSFLADPGLFAQWRQFGGGETLISYGIDLPARADQADPERLRAALRAALPVSHLRFLRALPALHRIGGYAFVHAGVKPGVTLDAQVETDLLWIRQEFLDYPGDFGAVVVHGHTPQDTIDLKPNRINIDTGAYMTNRLTCAVLDADGVRFLQTTREGIVARAAGDL